MGRLSQEDQLGPYRIIGPLGKGGMGEAYRAHDPRLGRDVAIKVMSENLTANEPSRLRFEREAKAVAALSHPNIVSIFDIGVESGSAFLVSELLEGRTLRDELAGGNLPIEKVLEWGSAIADGIAAAHLRGIVHRDLKPENIFITSAGRVKILDFGLAQIHAAAGDSAKGPSEVATAVLITQQGTILGTVGYLSPEQICCEDVGPPSDIFALGCVLYEMATGQSPFLRPTSTETLVAVLHATPKPPSEATPGVPRELDMIIDRCLRKDPAERHSSAADLASALRTGSGPVAPASSATTTTAPASSRKLSRASMIAIVAAIVILGGSLLVWDVGNRSDSPETNTVRVTGAPITLAIPVFVQVRGGATEYSAAAVQGEIVRWLSRSPRIRIVADNTVRELMKGVPDSEMAKKLGIDYFIIGRVADDDAIHTTIEVRRQSGESTRVEVMAADLPAAGRLTAERIIRELGLPDLAAQEEPTEADPKATRLYYEGRHFWNKRDAEGLQKAIELFHQAIDVDPQFALAYVGLAEAYSVLNNAASLPTSETFPRARAAARRALEIDESLAEAHVSLAYVMEKYDRDWAEAEKEYQRAIALRPDYATAHQWYAELLTSRGRKKEASAAMQRARELDPLSPIIAASDIWLELMFRDYDAAVRSGRSAIAAFPDFPISHSYTARALVEKGSNDEAIAMHRRAVSLRPSRVLELWLAEALARDGARAESLEILRRIETSGDYVNPYYLAFPYIAMGDHERALTLLEEAVETSVEQLAWFDLDPSLDPLRTSPRFQSLSKRLEVPREVK